MILRPKHFKAIEFLAGSDLAQDEIARRVGVSRRTLSRWLADETFNTELVRGRDALPYSFDGLRVRTARLLLLDIVRRLEAHGETLPLKEMTTLLAQLMGESAGPGADELSAEDGCDAEGARRDFPELTPEQADEIWAKFDEVVSRGQKNPDPPPPENPGHQETPSA